MATNAYANIMGNQNSFNPVNQAPRFPISQAMGNFVGPFGAWQGFVRGSGTLQYGPTGISTSVPFAPGFSATPANSVNGLGLASPFGTASAYLTNYGFNSPIESYTPLLGTPYDLWDGIIAATGAYGGYQSPLSPYSGSGLPASTFPDGSFGFGGPGGSQPGNIYNSHNFGGLGMADFAGGGLASPGGAFGGGQPQLAGLGGNPSGGLVSPGAAFGGSAPHLAGLTSMMGGGQGLSGFPGGGLGSGAPQLAGLAGPGFGGLPGGLASPGAALGGGLPQAGGFPGAPQSLPQGAPGNNFPDLFGNPSLFAPVPNNVIPGLAQSFAHQGGGFGNQYSQIGDGISKGLLYGQADPRMPRQLYNSGSSLRSPLGIFETGVGWAGGTANAGIAGTQASGMAWAMVRNPVNPACIVNYSNPAYANYNWNQGFGNW